MREGSTGRGAWASSHSLSLPLFLSLSLSLSLPISLSLHLSISKSLNLYLSISLLRPPPHTHTPFPLRKQVQIETQRKIARAQKERARLAKERRRQAVNSIMAHRAPSPERAPTGGRRQPRGFQPDRQKDMAEKQKGLRAKRKREEMKVLQAKRKKEKEERERDLWHGTMVLEGKFDAGDGGSRLATTSGARSPATVRKFRSLTKTARGTAARRRENKREVSLTYWGRG